MVFKLEISRDNSTFFEVDLFPDPQLEYNVDFYDSLEPNKIRLPFSSSMKIPMTTLNMGTSRFAYNPLVDTQDLFPKDPFFFKITVFGSSEVNLEGLLNVQSFEYLSDEPYIDVNLDDYVSKYISELKDAGLYELYQADLGTYGTYFVDDNLFTTFFTDEAGTLNQNPLDRPIIFPYIDFCNDVKGKFNYAERQFTEYGAGMDRAGIVPTYSVKNFLSAVGDYLTAKGFNTRVDSKLFGLNYAAAITDMQPEKLQMLIPSKIEADVATNTREFYLRQAPFWTGTNEALDGDIDQDGNDKLLITNYFWNSETFGNFGAFVPNPENPSNTLPVTNQTKYGLDVTNAAYPPNPAIQPFAYERGYFSPFMSYSSDIVYKSGNAFANVAEINFEIPIIDEDKMVYQIDTVLSGSTMTFGIFIGIYENGELIKKIRLQDAAGSAGNPIILNASDATTIAGFSNKTDHTGNADHNYYKDSSYSTLLNQGYVIFDSGLSDVEDMLNWNLVDLGLNELYLPDETIDISGESRYGINYLIEPVDGELVVRYGSRVAPHSSGGDNHYDIDQMRGDVFGVSSIRKAITRTDQYGQLDIEFTANANFNPYFDDDIYNLRDSIRNTATLSPYEVLLALCKRFGCGIFYEYDDVSSKNVLRVDPLHLVRSGSQDINELIDDLRSVKVYLGGDKVKNLTINNEDYGLYFDDEDGDKITIGSTTQEINDDGVSDLVIDLKSSIYYDSVCGEELFQEENENLINGVVSSSEVSFTPNLFTKHQEIGLRFAYVDKPLYSTYIKIPFVVNSDYRPNIYTVTQKIYINWEDISTQTARKHIFNGRLFHYNTAGWNLMAEDENGNTTDYYALFEANEKIRFSNSPTIEFNMVVPTSELGSLDFFFQTLSATRINQSSIVVKSAEGEVFEDYAYLTIKGLLQ